MLGAPLLSATFSHQSSHPWRLLVDPDQQPALGRCLQASIYSFTQFQHTSVLETMDRSKAAFSAQRHFCQNQCPSTECCALGDSCTTRSIRRCPGLMRPRAARSNADRSLRTTCIFVGDSYSSTLKTKGFVPRKNTTVEEYAFESMDKASCYCRGQS